MHYSIVFNNNKVQNEGFTILSKQGVTISHVTLNNTLNKVKSDIDKKNNPLYWKLGVEKDSRRISSSESKSDHEYTRNTDFCNVTETQNRVAPERILIWQKIMATVQH